MKTSWKTTLFGVVAAAAAGIAAAYQGTTIGTIAQTVGMIASGLIGLVARDNNLSSEQVGAGNTGAK